MMVRFEFWVHPTLSSWYSYEKPTVIINYKSMCVHAIFPNLNISSFVCYTHTHVFIAYLKDNPMNKHNTYIIIDE